MDEFKVLSHMTGTVVGINVKEGDKVGKDQELLVLEAMKMEMTVQAGRDGIVAQILVSEGDFVNEGDTVMVLKPES
jgi:biotin carboxyl carrier protein